MLSHLVAFISKYINRAKEIFFCFLCLFRINFSFFPNFDRKAIEFAAKV